MPAVKRWFNARQVVYDHNAYTDSIGVYMSDGSLWYHRWCGWVDVKVARDWQLQGLAHPVKLHIDFWSPVDAVSGFLPVPAGECLQGAKTSLGVFGVLMDGVPRLVSRRRPPDQGAAVIAVDPGK